MIVIEKRPDEAQHLRGCDIYSKSSLHALARNSIRLLPTLKRAGVSPWTRCVVKPDFALGPAMLCETPTAFGRAVSLHDAAGVDWVVQPFVSGTELRVTASSIHETFISRLCWRAGARSAWSSVAGSEWSNLRRCIEALRERADVNVLGCDVVLASGRLWLLDANPCPDLAMHA